MKKFTTNEFINRSILVHQNNYNYDKVIYINMVKKVIITCKKHGDFLQMPNNHLTGHGCMECSGKTEKNTERFIAEANVKHNFSYNYDKVNYTKAHQKVIITCKIHGDFMQAAYSHLSGIGCLECSGKTKRSSQRFIEESNKIHYNNFTYDKVIYRNKSEKVIITCKKHGDFEQIPNDHLRGHGCYECAGTKPITTQKFIEKANELHNYIYNYDKVAYINAKTKIIINCKNHGDFKQNPHDHLSGSGCPKCKSSNGEKLISEVLHKMNIKFMTQYKFEDCIYKRKLLFDFALFTDDKIKLIEFHGRQHFDYISFFHKKNGRNESLLRDKIKQDYACANNIELLIIPYTDTINIEALVSNFV